MNRYIILTVGALVALLGSTIIVRAQDTAAATDQAQQAEADGNAQLAERFAEFAQNTLRTRKVTDVTWKESIIYLKAACRLNPTEPRFARLLVEAMLQTRDTNGAIEALVNYRKIAPEDRLAQIQLIDLYVTQMETIEARIDYLKDIVGRPGVSDDVRSHAACRVTKLLLERGQDTPAAAMLSQSLNLNSLNLEALSLQVERTRSNGSPLERVSSMLQYLRANPANPGLCIEIARLAAQHGQTEAAVIWFQQGLNIGQRTPWQFFPDDLTDYLSSLYIANQAAAADGMSQQMVKVYESDVNSNLIRVLIARTIGKPESIDAASKQAENVLNNNLAVARQKLGQTSATTQPVASSTVPAVPDLLGDSALLEKAEPETVSAYVGACADWAWFKIYFNNDTESAGKLITAIRPLVADDSAVLARLDGWSDLIGSKFEDAKKKLEPAADKDPLCAAGLARALLQDPAQKDKALTLARKTIFENASGITGAMLWDALRAHQVKIISTDAGEAIKKELDRFPMAWLHIVDKPQDFYSVRIEPLHPSYSFREPMLAQVTFSNPSEFDITLGSSGIVHGDLWFDAKVKGINPQSFTGVAFEQFYGGPVLRARQAKSQIVRLDRGDLYNFLASNPTVAMNVEFTLNLNPTAAGQGLGIGPGGFQVTSTRVFARSPFGMTNDDARKRIFELLQTGTPVEKISAIETLGVYAGAFLGKDANEQLHQVGGEFLDMIARSKLDKVSAVATWSNFITASAGRPEERPLAVARLVDSPNWYSRLIGILTSTVLGEAKQKEVLTRLSKDEDELVRSLAQTSLDSPAPAKPSGETPAATIPPPGASSNDAAPGAGESSMPKPTDILMK